MSGFCWGNWWAMGLPNENGVNMKNNNRIASNHGIYLSMQLSWYLSLSDCFSRCLWEEDLGMSQWVLMMWLCCGESLLSQNVQKIIIIIMEWIFGSSFCKISKQRHEGMMMDELTREVNPQEFCFFPFLQKKEDVWNYKKKKNGNYKSLFFYIYFV